MTEYTCDKSVCENVDLLTLLLRYTKEQKVNGIKSVLGILAEGTQTPAKKWVMAGEYKVGDIVSLGNIIYIAVKDNINKSPIIYRDNWLIFKLPYTQNSSKIKAYVLYKTDGTILKSYNIASIVDNGDMKFTINFITNPGLPVICVPGIVESIYDYNYGLEVETSSISTTIKVKTTNIDQTSLLNFTTDTNDLYISAIFYSTSDVLH
jgi:hypothetical protein